MIVAWIIFATAGIFQARYMKNITKKWFIWHSISQFGSLALTTIGIALALKSFEVIITFPLHNLFSTSWLSVYIKYLESQFFRYVGCKHS